MSLRPAVLAWSARYGLAGDQRAALAALAGLDREPAAVARRFWPVVGVLAAALAGLGLILWIAANWSGLGRAGRFGLLQLLLLALCAGAAWRAAWRAPLALGAFLTIGGLFAFFGQTYQTGADAWQLFAVWAVLALPLAIGARSDVVWAPWALVALVGVSLWTVTHTGHRWRVQPEDLRTHATAWVTAALLVAALTPAWSRFTGAGPWALRTAGTLAVTMVVLSALGGLFHRDVAPHYAVALLVLGGAALALAQARFFEVFLLSAVALALNVLIVAGAGRWLFTSGSSGDFLGKLLLLGLFAAGLLAASVAFITHLARQAAPRADG